MADLLGSLLAKDYRIFLFSSNREEDLSREDFQHPRLTFLPHPIPRGEALASEIPESQRSGILWMTEDAELHEWLRNGKHKLASLSAPQGFGDRHIRIGSPGELAVLFDPMGRVLKEVGEAVLARLSLHNQGAFLIGVGGPPLSGFEQFAVDLRNSLQSLGCPVVDLLDTSVFLGEQGGAPGEGHSSWTEPAGGAWLLKEVLQPLGAGERIFVENLPPGVPAGFEPHLPLFLSEESVVLIIGERVFVQPVSETLDVRILLEMSPRETARRLYEIPEVQPFEEKFVTQYLDHQGGRYKEYLEDFRVEKEATIRISAEKEGQFSITHKAGI